MHNKVIVWCDNTIEWSLYFLIFCLPFSKAGVSIFAVLAIAAWVIKRIFGFRADGFAGLLPATPLNKALLIFVLFNILSVIFTVDIDLSLRAFFTKTLKFIMIFLIVSETFNSKKRIQRFLTVIILSSVLMSIDAGFQYVTGTDFLKGHSGVRLRASFSAPNGFAAWLSMLIFILCGIFLAKEKKNANRRLKFASAALAMILAASLILTYTRGAWGGFLIGLIILVFFLLKNKSWRAKVIAILCILALCASCLFMWPVLKRGIASLSPGSQNEASLEERMTLSVGFTGRKNLWSEALQIIEDFPLLGCGLNTYSITAPHYKVAEGGGIYSHNSYLQMAAEIGLLGFGTFCYVFYCFFRSGIQYFNKFRDYLLLGILCGLLAFLVHAFFDNHLYAFQLAYLFWFMLGLATAIIKWQSAE